MRLVPRVPPFDRPATYEDLVALPEPLVAEIVDGELHASPRPAVWLLDPLAQTFEVLRLEADRWSILVTHVGLDVVRAEPFGEVDIPLSLLWGDDYGPRGWSSAPRGPSPLLDHEPAPPPRL